MKKIERACLRGKVTTMNFLEKKLQEIRTACKTYGVKSLHAFGSVLSDSFSSRSDVDLLVTFSESYESGAFAQYFDFKEELESILGFSVDLVCYQAIRNTVFKNEVDNEKKLLYAA